MTRPNVARLQGTLAWIEANPDSWNQAEWTCGTAACYAGLTVTLAGYHMDDEAYVLMSDLPAELRTELLYASSDKVGRVHVADLATLLLGIRNSTVTIEAAGWQTAVRPAEALFDATNSLDDLRNYVAQLCEEETS